MDNGNFSPPGPQVTLQKPEKVWPPDLDRRAAIFI
jgi:hypothetical protein